MPATLLRTWSAWSLKRLRKAEGMVTGARFRRRRGRAALSLILDARRGTGGSRKFQKRLDGRICPVFASDGRANRGRIGQERAG